MRAYFLIQISLSLSLSFFQYYTLKQSCVSVLVRVLQRNYICIYLRTERERERERVREREREQERPVFSQPGAWEMSQVRRGGNGNQGRECETTGGKIRRPAAGAAEVC